MPEIELMEEHIERFFWFMNERQLVYLSRQRNDIWPWTDDPILQKYKFTNVYREQDTGTVWLREHIREPYADHPELFFNIALYRRYNYWPMAQHLMDVVGFIDDYAAQYEEVDQVVRTYRAGGGQVFTGAHMLNCAPGMDKITHVFDLIGHDLWEHRADYQPAPGDTLEQAFNRLSAAYGFGPFISYEVVTDLRHTRYLRKATDVYTWANPGPGAQRGVLRLMGLPIINQAGLPKRSPDQPSYPDGYIAVMRYLVELADEFLEPYMMFPIEMRDIEHSLCEFDKYERVRLGEGRPRSLFIPPHLR